MSTMSAADITAILAGQRERGGHEKEIRNFVASEVLAEDFALRTRYSAKTDEQLKVLKNQLTKIAKDNELNVRFVYNDDEGSEFKLLAVNLDVHEAALAS